VQRVEKESSASLQTKKALASALYFQYSGMGEELLPKASKGLFSVAKICPFVCLECGHIRLLASSEAREIIVASEHWKPV